MPFKVLHYITLQYYCDILVFKNFSCYQTRCGRQSFYCFSEALNKSTISASDRRPHRLSLAVCQEIFRCLQVARNEVRCVSDISSHLRRRCLLFSPLFVVFIRQRVCRLLLIEPLWTYKPLKTAEPLSTRRRRRGGRGRRRRKLRVFIEPLSLCDAAKNCDSLEHFL